MLFFWFFFIHAIQREVIVQQNAFRAAAFDANFVKPTGSEHL